VQQLASLLERKWGQRQTRDVDKNEAKLRHQIFVVGSIFLVWFVVGSIFLSCVVDIPRVRPFFFP
jgi:hypothetical protein